MIYRQYTAQHTGAKILVWKIVETVTELQKLLGNFDTYISEYQNIKLEKRKLEFLAVRVALNTLLKCEVKIVYNANGKPFLSDRSHEISISHSGNCVAVMAHPEAPAGIDIEKKSERFLTLYRRYTSVTEQIELISGEKSLPRFQLAWSAKEAMYKIFGDEVLDFTNDIRIFSFEPDSSGFIRAEHIKRKTVHRLQYVTDDEWNMVWSDWAENRV